jgi:peptide-methionine (S)-S-oxide reductase
MTSRFLAAALTFSLVLGSAGGVAADDPAKPTSTPDAPSTPTDPGKSADPKATEPSSSTKAETPKAKAKLEKATFASGCFWCGEAVFERIEGVKNVVSGYTGGNVPYPNYEMVGTGETGHAEAFQVTFDPNVVSYDKLLKVFWASHDPTTPNQQGPDFGTQYRSAIFYHTEAQKEAAQKSFQELAKNGVLVSAISTQLVPASVFYPAEAYHQDYYRRHKSALYCQTWITPKLKKLHLIK